MNCLSGARGGGCILHTLRGSFFAVPCTLLVLFPFFEQNENLGCLSISWGWRFVSAYGLFTFVYQRY